jgi:hypothetical protein
MPYIESGVAQRLAAFRVDKSNAYREWQAGLTLGKIGAEFSAIDIVGTFFLLAGEYAGGIRGCAIYGGSGESGGA